MFASEGKQGVIFYASSSSSPLCCLSSRSPPDVIDDPRKLAQGSFDRQKVSHVSMENRNSSMKLGSPRIVEKYSDHLGMDESIWLDYLVEMIFSWSTVPIPIPRKIAILYEQKEHQLFHIGDTVWRLE